MRKLSTAIMGLSLFLSPVAVSAQTLVQLQAEVAQLMQQLSAVQSGQGGTPSSAMQKTTTSTPCPNLTRTLSRGMHGADVTQLQNFLISQNHLAAGNNTGLFGALTEAAVKKFQCAQNITCTGTPVSTGYGTVGARTRAAISTQCRRASITPSYSQASYTRPGYAQGSYSTPSYSQASYNTTPQPD